jgi:tRNA-dihydrouridine synthase B
MLKIGEVSLDNRIIAAPMAGVTDKANRIMAKSFACAMTCSEMISDMGLIYGLDKTQAIANTQGEERPVCLQIFGSHPERMAQAAQIVENLGADIIDINMGCPTPKIVKNGEGCALMLDLERSRALIRAVVNAVRVPVSIKMRRGWEDGSKTFLELAGIAEQEGVKAITLHARSRMQFYSGQADWGLIKELKERSGLPIIGNGDIWSAEDAVRMLETTACDAVMIGRAAMGNPFIFREAVELMISTIEYYYQITPFPFMRVYLTVAHHIPLFIHKPVDHYLIAGRTCTLDRNRYLQIADFFYKTGPTRYLPYQYYFTDLPVRKEMFNESIGQSLDKLIAKYKGQIIPGVKT